MQIEIGAVQEDNGNWTPALVVRFPGNPDITFFADVEFETESELKKFSDAIAKVLSTPADKVYHCPDGDVRSKVPPSDADIN